MNCASDGKVTGATGTRKISGTRVGNTFTVTVQTSLGSRGPYNWQLNGGTLTGTEVAFCTDIATGALTGEGVESFTMQLP